MGNWHFVLVYRPRGLQASTGERKRKGRDNKKNGKGGLCSRSIIRGRVVSANVSFQMFNAFSLCCPLLYSDLLNPGLHEDPGESNTPINVMPGGGGGRA